MIADYLPTERALLGSLPLNTLNKEEAEFCEKYRPAFEIGRLAGRMAKGYYAHKAAIDVAKNPRSNDLVRDLRIRCSPKMDGGSDRRCTARKRCWITDRKTTIPAPTFFHSLRRFGSLQLDNACHCRVSTLRVSEVLGWKTIVRKQTQRLSTDCLAHLLRNRFYIGEVAFKGEILKGEQSPIIDRDLFDAVQAKLEEQKNSHMAKRMNSNALLVGRLFDDRGNRMSPSHARKGDIKYRYYLSSAFLNGLTDRAGSVPRVAAEEIEKLVIKSLQGHLGLEQQTDDRAIIKAHVSHVEIRSDEIVVHLAQAEEASASSPPIASAKALHIPWQKAPSKRQREILVPHGIQSLHARPIRSESRATLVASIARGRRWLDELTTDATATAETIAKREGCSARKVNMTISLAFLAPDLVKAAIEGRLPHGMGVTRLADLPAEWSRQHQMLDLPTQ